MADTLNPEPALSEENISPTNKLARNRSLLIFFAILCGLFVLMYFAWLTWYAHYESTENAYVNANIVVVTAQQPGRILAYRADNTQYVEMGDLLVELDPADYASAFERAQSELALSARHVLVLYEEVRQKQAEESLQEVRYQRALLDFQNHTDLIKNKALSAEDFEHIKSDLKIAEASLQCARAQLQAAQAALGKQELAHHPDIENAKSKARDAYLALKRCRILAPTSGYIANRTVEIGQAVNVTTALMNIIPLHNIWVDANYKETQLANIRIGQPVHLTADMYGDAVIFHGKVVGITPGTGSSFSLLPPQNASGNWIKIVQRVPVRIALHPEELKLHPLFLGLSMYATIDISNLQAPMLSKQSVEEAPTATNIFDIPLKEIDAQLDAIVAQNLQQSQA